MEVTGHKAHGLIPEPGSLVLARVTKVMARMASVDILCVGSKAVREKFAGVIRSFMDPSFTFTFTCMHHQSNLWLCVFTQATRC